MHTNFHEEIMTKRASRNRIRRVSIIATVVVVACVIIYLAGSIYLGLAQLYV